MIDGTAGSVYTIEYSGELILQIHLSWSSYVTFHKGVNISALIYRGLALRVILIEPIVSYLRNESSSF